MKIIRFLISANIRKIFVMLVNQRVKFLVLKKEFSPFKK